MVECVTIGDTNVNRGAARTKKPLGAAICRSKQEFESLSRVILPIYNNTKPAVVPRMIV